MSDSTPFNPKDLKKLADACRKAGIKTFKGYGFEFTLTDELPQRPRKASAKANETQGNVESDEPSAEELMFWSSGQGIPILPAGDQTEQGNKS